MRHEVVYTKSIPYPPYTRITAIVAEGSLLLCDEAARAYNSNGDRTGHAYVRPFHSYRECSQSGDTRTCTVSHAYSVESARDESARDLELRLWNSQRVSLGAVHDLYVSHGTGTVDIVAEGGTRRERGAAIGRAARAYGGLTRYHASYDEAYGFQTQTRIRYTRKEA